MMTEQCKRCEHLDRDNDGLACAAFGDKIPEVILTGEHDHTKPYKGDNGIRFEPIKK